jgi:hypothetical protein
VLPELKNKREKDLAYRQGAPRPLFSRVKNNLNEERHSGIVGKTTEQRAGGRGERP